MASIILCMEVSSSTMNPKLRGNHPSACSDTPIKGKPSQCLLRHTYKGETIPVPAQIHLKVQKTEPIAEVCMRTRGGREGASVTNFKHSSRCC